MFSGTNITNTSNKTNWILTARKVSISSIPVLYFLGTTSLCQVHFLDNKNQKNVKWSGNVFCAPSTSRLTATNLVWMYLKRFLNTPTAAKPILKLNEEPEVARFWSPSTAINYQVGYNLEHMYDPARPRTFSARECLHARPFQEMNDAKGRAPKLKNTILTTMFWLDLIISRTGRGQLRIVTTFTSLWTDIPWNTRLMATETLSWIAHSFNL